MSFNALSVRAASISQQYLQKIADDDAFWAGSPFDWIRRLPSRTRGAIVRTLAESIFEQNGYAPQHRPNSFEIDGTNIISRSSMIWETGDWKFQQVRDTNFDFLFCLGLLPHSASAWLMPKSELYLADGSLTDRPGWAIQHGGQTGTEDAWLNVDPTNVQPWLNQFGGDVSHMSHILSQSL